MADVSTRSLRDTVSAIEDEIELLEFELETLISEVLGKPDRPLVEVMADLERRLHDTATRLTLSKNALVEACRNTGEEPLAHGRTGRQITTARTRE